MTTDSFFATLDAEIEAAEFSRRSEEAEREARKSALIDVATAAIRALIVSLDEPAAAMLWRAWRVDHATGNATMQRVNGKATIEGLAPIYFEAIANADTTTAHVTEIRTAGQAWSYPEPAGLRDVLIAARAAYLREQAELRQAEERRTRKEHWAEQQRQEQRAALDAALAAWEPAYRAFLSDLDTAYTHNAAILRKIAGDLATTPFEVRRLTYGIVYGEGADPATDDAWIISHSGRAEIEEIGNDGIIFDTRYYFPVSVTAIQTWTPAKCREEHAWSTDKRPPIRRYTKYNGWLTVEFFAPPSRRPLGAEVDDAIFHAGGLLDWPTPPPPPAPPAPQWKELILRRAADLAAELLSTAAHDEIGERAIRTAISDFDF